MTIFIEIFVALFFLFVSGSIHSAWQTNPILKSKIGRGVIVAVLISGVLLWHFYPAGTTVVSDEEIELKFWQSVEKTGTQESYCAYFEKYPNGEFAVLAEQKWGEFKQTTQKSHRIFRALNS
jgi:hypothetical protein